MSDISMSTFIYQYEFMLYGFCVFMIVSVGVSCVFVHDFCQYNWSLCPEHLVTLLQNWQRVNPTTRCATKNYLRLSQKHHPPP